MCTYTNGLKAFALYLAVLSLFEYTSCFIFIAVPFSSVNPGAFPKEVKSEQTAIKLIEAARYQFRCLRPWQHILHWPCRTLARCYLSKFNSWPAATDPTAASLFFLNVSDWNTHSNTHRPDYHAGESLLLWVRPEHEGLAEPYPSALSPPARFTLFSFAVSSAIILTHILKYLFLTMILDYILCVNLFAFLSLLSVGNHLGAMLHQRWAKQSHCFTVSLHFNALWMCT